VSLFRSAFPSRHWHSTPIRNSLGLRVRRSPILAMCKPFILHHRLKFFAVGLLHSACPSHVWCLISTRYSLRLRERHFPSVFDWNRFLFHHQSKFLPVTVLIPAFISRRLHSSVIQDSLGLRANHAPAVARWNGFVFPRHIGPWLNTESWFERLFWDLYISWDGVLSFPGYSVSIIRGVDNSAGEGKIEAVWVGRLLDNCCWIHSITSEDSNPWSMADLTWHWGVSLDPLEWSSLTKSERWLSQWKYVRSGQVSIALCE
jgi:hypothetical protein